MLAANRRRSERRLCRRIAKIQCGTGSLPRDCTITDVSAALQAAVDRLSEAIATARQPGQPLSTISAITREAPLASLLIAFLFGVAVARRR